MIYSLGVDLGTSTVTAAVVDPDGPRMIALGERGVGAPAVVHVGDDDAVVTGDEAERRAADRPDRAVRGLRSRLRDGGTVVLGTAAYPVVGLLGAQLRDVVRRVTDTEGGPPERVVLTCPPTWDDDGRQRLVEVGAAAGIASPLVVPESEAAAFSVFPGLGAREHVAVYDLGGGGFHGAVVQGRASGPEIVGTPEGDERVGGLAFDEAVLRHVAATAGVPIDGAADAGWTARLRRDCTRAKEALSVDPEATVAVFLPDGPVEVRLTRATFEELVRGSVESTTRALYRTIRSADLLPSDLRTLLVLGGSSRIPLVAEMLSQQFGRPFARDVDPKNAVALGAAAIGARSIGTAAAGAAVGAGAGRVAGRPVVALAPERAAPVGGTVAPILTAPGGDADADLTPLRALPQRWPGSSIPAGDPRPSPRRIWLPIAAAAVAVLVLVGVFALATSGTPTPPAVPADAPPATTAPPSTPAPSSSAPPSTTAGPTTTATTAPTRTRVPPRTTTKRPSGDTSRATASRTTRPNSTTTTTKKKKR